MCLCTPAPTAAEWINPEPLQSNRCVGTAAQQGGNTTETSEEKGKESVVYAEEREITSEGGESGVRKL